MLISFRKPAVAVQRLPPRARLSGMMNVASGGAISVSKEPSKDKSVGGLTLGNSQLRLHLLVLDHGKGTH